VPEPRDSSRVPVPSEPRVRGADHNPEIGRFLGLVSLRRATYNEPSFFSIAAIESGEHFREDRTRIAPESEPRAGGSGLIVRESLLARRTGGFQSPFAQQERIPGVSGARTESRTRQNRSLTA